MHDCLKLLCEEQTKRCTTCKQHIKLTAFNKDKSRTIGHNARCINCSRAKGRQYYLNHNCKLQDCELKTKYCKWHNVVHKLIDFSITASSTGHANLCKLGFNEKKYNLSPGEFKLLVKQQNDLCGICNLPFGAGTLKPVIDHCHKSKKVRAILHDQCNVALGIVQENIQLCESLIGYIKKAS